MPSPTSDISIFPESREGSGGGVQAVFVPAVADVCRQNETIKYRIIYIYTRI